MLGAVVLDVIQAEKFETALAAARAPDLTAAAVVPESRVAIRTKTRFAVLEIACPAPRVRPIAILAAVELSDRLDLLAARALHLSRQLAWRSRGRIG
jgi:hypothetical protein